MSFSSKLEPRNAKMISAKKLLKMKRGQLLWSLFLRNFARKQHFLFHFRMPLNFSYTKSGKKIKKVEKIYYAWMSLTRNTEKRLLNKFTVWPIKSQSEQNVCVCGPNPQRTKSSGTPGYNTHTHACMHTCIHTCMHAHMHACTHVCTHTPTHVHPQVNP